MGFLDGLKKLFGVSPYADYRRRTRTGKLRAKAGPIESQEKMGTDWAIYKVEALSKSAKKVYRYLSAIADKDGYCFPFYKTIARRTELSESTVSKAINELEEFGLITRRQRVSRRGGSSNLYHVERVSEVVQQKKKRMDEPCPSLN